MRITPKPQLALLVATCACLNGQDVRTIHRLDGSKITFAEAQAFASKTLRDAQVTGAQLAVIDKGHLVWSEAFGKRRLEPELPMMPETAIWAASITKGVFATYVMQLVRRREFDLDAPVARLLPKPLNDYEAYKDKSSELVRDPAWKTVTPRMLLSHTSGLANFANLEADKKMHLRFKPGTQFLYSGEGINLVQFVIEQQKGKSITDLMEDALFRPLGMSHTAMIYRKDLEANISDRFDANQKFHAQTRRFPAHAAGSLTTSVVDLAKFFTALLSDKIIDKAGMKEMLKPEIELRSLHEFPLRANEGTSGETTNVGLAYGLGWGLLTHTRFGAAFFKEGHGDGAQNYVICFERRKACMILLTNSENGELAFRPLLEKIFGDTVTPWEWEGYTKEYIEQSRRQQ